MLDNGENNRITKKTTVSGGSKEVISELSLPDYLPDVSRLLRTNADIGGENSYVNGQTLEYDGEINYLIVYATSDGRIKSVPLSAEYDGVIPLPETDGDVDARAAVKIENVNCRLQNPRRLTVRTKLNVSADVYENVGVSPTISGKISAEEEARIERRSEGIESMTLVCVADENVPISEDVELDAQNPSVAEIVSVTLTPFINEARASEGSLSYRGDVVAEIIYLAAQGDAERQAEYFAFRKKIPISGDVAADGVTDGCCAYGYATVSGVEYRPQANAFGENRVVEIDFSYTASLCALCNVPTQVVTDMYSTDYASVTEPRELEYRRALRAGAFNFTCDGASSLDEKDYDRVVAQTATASIDKTERNGSKAVFGGKTDVTVILTNGAGSYIGRTFSVPLRAETEVGKGAGELECAVYPSVIGTYVRADGGELRCDVEVGLSFAASDVCKMTAIDKCVVQKDRPSRKISPASIVICYPAQGEELWDIAKRYGVSTETLRAANSLSGDAVAGKVLIIPTEKQKKSII